MESLDSPQRIHSPGSQDRAQKHGSELGQSSGPSSKGSISWLLLLLLTAPTFLRTEQVLGSLTPNLQPHPTSGLQR